MKKIVLVATFAAFATVSSPQPAEAWSWFGVCKKLFDPSELGDGTIEGYCKTIPTDGDAGLGVYLREQAGC